MMNYKKKLVTVLCAVTALTALTGFIGCKAPVEGGTSVIAPQEEELAFSINVKETYIYSSFQLHINKTDNVVFSSSDESICSVDENGLVYAQGFGEAVITATRGEQTAQCRVTVVGESIVPSIQVAQESVSLVYSKNKQSGSSFAIQPQISFNGGSFADGEFTFVSSNPSVAEVNANGEISAKGFGEAVISIQGSWRGSFDSTVLNKNITVTVIPDASIELKAESTVLSTVSATIGGKEYSNQTSFSASVMVDGEAHNAEITYTGYDDSMIAIDGNTITAGKRGQTSVVANCTIEGIAISSTPLAIEVVAPTVTASEERVYNVKDNPIYTFEDAEGEFISVSINGITHNDCMDGQTYSLDMTSFYESVLGDSFVELQTSKYTYQYSVKFVTNIITNGEEFSDCITNKDKTIYALLQNDITFSAGEWRAKSATFKGVFDGQGHTIDAMGTTICNVYGLFGRLSGELRNFALINATVYGKESTVLGERIYEGGAVKNLYVQAVYEENTQMDYTELDAKATPYYCGLFQRGFRFENIIVNIEYPTGVTGGFALCGYSNVVLVQNSYCFGNASQLAKTDSSVCYANVTEMLAANLASLSYKNGFSQSWYFADKMIKFGDLRIGDPLVKDKISTKQSLTLRLSDLALEEVIELFIDGKSVEIPANGELSLGVYEYSPNEEHIVTLYTEASIIEQRFVFALTEENKTQTLYGKDRLELSSAEYDNATVASLNGEVFEAKDGKLTVDLSALTVGADDNIYLYANEKVIKQPVVKVTHIISTAAELKEYMPNSGELRANATSGTYAILTADIDFGGESFSAGTGNSDGYKGRFNGLGHTISNVAIHREGGFFGVLYKGTVVENVRFVNMEYAGKNVGGGLIAATVGRMGEGDPARMENVYIQGKVTTAGAKHGLFNVRTNTGNTVVMKNCIVDIVFVEPAETSYVLGASEGEIKVSFTGVYVKSNATQFTATDTTKAYATEKELLAASIEAVKSWGGYWSVVNGEIYFNGQKVVSK